MICPKCGTQLNDGAAFCPKCGNRVENSTTNNVPNQPMANNLAGHAVVTETTKEKHSTWKTVLIAILATIVVGFVGLIILGSKSTNSETEDVSTSERSIEAWAEEDSNAPKESDPEAVKELLGYIDRVEELYSEAVNDVNALNEDNENDIEKYKKQVVVLENLLTDMSDLQRQMNEISGIDKKLENAKKEYFNMQYDSAKAYYEMHIFYADYFDLYYNNLIYRPQEDEYDSAVEYFYGLNEWYEVVKEGYMAIESCPFCLESKWEKYGEILDLNASIIQKIYLAVQSGDNLRYQSARNMSNRYNIVEELQFDGFFNSFSGEVNHIQRQKNIASKLAEEMHAYAEMGEEERSVYEFEYIRTGKIGLDYEALDIIYPALYNTYDAFVIIKTGCASGSRKILVEAEIPGLTQNYKESFTLDSAYQEIYIKPPALTGALDLSSAKEAQMQVTISEQDGTLIEAKTFPVTIKSKFDVEWYTNEFGVATKDNMLCFLTPESTAMAELKRQAIEEISDMTGGRLESFVGYQDSGFDYKVGTYLQAAGVMRAMYEMGVRYNMDTFSISGSHQHVLFPEDVLKQKGGLCIETTLVVASALQSADMHAFIVLPPGHAQVAVETWEGSGEYFLIETTALEGNSNNRQAFVSGANQLINSGKVSGIITYMDQESWYNYLSVDGTYLIDCDDSIVLGLTPFAN